MARAERVGLVLVLEAGIPPSRRNRIRTRLQELGATVRLVDGGARSYLEILDGDLPLRTLSLGEWQGVSRVVPLEPGQPLVSRDPGAGADQESTVVTLRGPQGPVLVGDGHFALMAGPCAVESEERAIRLAERLAGIGVQAFRGGAFKPRTSPYAFQGLGAEGLRILREARGRSGLPIVTEAMSTDDLDDLLASCDLLQVGARSMQNFPLLKRLGQLRHPVLLKRGFAATIDEWLHAAEYILSGGNDQVILCERGIRSSVATGGVVLDLGAIPELRRRTHLPVLVDPSHGTGSASRVMPLARAAVAAGADGLLVEVHDAPEEALSDGQQALSPAELERLAADVHRLREAVSPASPADPSNEHDLLGSLAKPAGRE